MLQTFPNDRVHCFDICRFRLFFISKITSSLAFKRMVKRSEKNTNLRTYRWNQMHRPLLCSIPMKCVHYFVCHDAFLSVFSKNSENFARQVNLNMKIFEFMARIFGKKGERPFELRTKTDFMLIKKANILFKLSLILPFHEKKLLFSRQRQWICRQSNSSVHLSLEISCRMHCWRKKNKMTKCNPIHFRNVFMMLA